MTADIVARLRDLEGGDGFRAICREAADEIERIRKERDDARQLINAAADVIERLRKERDEARRELCIALGKDHVAFIALPGEYNHHNAARDRGWDCFGE